MENEKKQLILGLPDIAKRADIDGIEMGVLKDGTAYVSARGLAKMCGLVPSAIIKNGGEFKRGENLNSKFSRHMVAQGVAPGDIFIPAVIDGKETHCYREKAVLAVLAFYAFDAEDRHLSPDALKNFRRLAQAGFREFIYKTVGFQPISASAPAVTSEQRHTDRVMLNSPPKGYFSVFRESEELAIYAMRAGLMIDDKTVPDISVGAVWAKYWKDNGLEDDFGPRKEHPHEYPPYYPQSKAGPKDAKVYPIEALPTFRRWLDDVYIPENLPGYLKAKAKQGAITEDEAKKLIEAAQKPLLGKKKAG